MLDSNKIFDCLLNNESDNENEVLHPKTAYTVNAKPLHFFNNQYISKLLKMKICFYSFAQLHQLSFDTPTFFTKLGEHQLGKPYNWAQNICGLNFISSTKPSTLSSSSSSCDQVATQETVPNVIEKMRIRLRSRFQLYTQILSLEKKTYDELIKTSCQSMASSKTTCILAQWSPITFKEYIERSVLVSRFIEENLATQNHLLYHAVIIRASAKMDCFISVSPNFPEECPIWAISLNFNGNHLNTSNNLDIKVNIFDFY